LPSLSPSLSLSLSPRLLPSLSPRVLPGLLPSLLPWMMVLAECYGAAHEFNRDQFNIRFNIRLIAIAKK
jgi:hypothetical protein